MSGEQQRRPAVIEDDGPVGPWTMRDVADELMVTYETVRKLRKTDPTFPAPDGNLGGKPWWRTSTIREWDAARPGKRTGAGRPAAGLILRGVDVKNGLGHALALYGLVSRLDRAGVEGLSVSMTTAGLVRLHTSLTEDEVVDKFAAGVFRPAVSTWSTGAGLIGTTSRTAREAMQGIVAVGARTYQVLDYAEAVRVGLDLVERLEDVGVVQGGKIVHKAEAIRAAWQCLPEPAEAWVSACVDWWIDKGAAQYVVNPVAAGGGNAGRADWSSVYAQCVLALVDADDLGRAWWRDVLTGAGQTRGLKLSPSAFLDTYAADRGLLNPAWMVAAMEGLMLCQPTQLTEMGTGAQSRHYRPTWPIVGPALPATEDRSLGMEGHATALLRLPRPGQRVPSHEFVRWLSLRPFPEAGMDVGDVERPTSSRLNYPRDRVARYRLGIRESAPFALFDGIWPGTHQTDSTESVTHRGRGGGR